MKWLLNFKRIRSKMIVGFSLVLFLVICLTAFNVFILNKNNQTVEEIVNRDFPIVLGDEKIIRSIYDRIGAARGYVLTGDSIHKENFAAAEELSSEHHQIIIDRVPISGFTEIRQKTSEWNDFILENVFALYDAGDQKGAYDNLLIADESVRDLVEDYEGGATSRSNQIKELEQMLLTDGKKTKVIVSIVSVLVVVLGISIAILTSNFISRPLQAVTNRMNRIADGDFSGEPIQTKTQDEIGQLTEATNRMNESVQGLLEDIHGVSQTVTHQSGELMQSSEEVREEASQIAATMEELASGSEMEASTVNNLSSQMNVFTVKVEEANENGEHIQQSSNEVLRMTNEGAELMDHSTEQMLTIDQIVQQAVSKVEGLDTQAKEISELVSVIQGIAEQTNLLALNAAIEAARAGEHGKGFAVVADEVRKLAEQSSHSVSNITDIVNNIQSESFSVVASLQAGYKEVETGTEQIQMTAETFRNIKSAVSDVVVRINQVSENLHDITANTQEMNSSIQEISAITEESSAGIEQTSTSSQQANSVMEEMSKSANTLASSSEELNKLINRFTV